MVSKETVAEEIGESKRAPVRYLEVDALEDLVDELVLFLSGLESASDGV